ncbi:MULTISPECIES: DNA polymerase IV [Dehalobacter]|jgi:DNA polymerase-4|uniref:DNA polymerase IV n=2 Tax=Dehalobacter restrictus TaxID=55583 RepID=A0A857DHZ8_9FIRM|nr:MULTISPECIES: DNA polymerase IV [Dehalobacter]AHF09385.1 DNA damage-inducible protein P [Dehalobacter restrictus DSM 9455]MCG1025907.1 DNA polymerase IV [Dehalobacter sp.]OCZ52068.1 DNA polymerase IV [Dehalobacter sp. TeCB1]QGZ99954.1 DNA polymerase IV [Dehalobacter restrictus]
MEEWQNHRKILHIDMDAFYAAVEQRDHPALLGKPVIVGGKPNSRGVVSAASYEARKFGIHSAMPMTEAFRRCPQAAFLPVNMQKYQEASDRIHEIFLSYTPLVEPLSLDEAFLDVTRSTALFGFAQDIAVLIKQRIRQELGLTASVGLAPNKFLAKIASDLQKPDGFVVVPPDKVQEFLDPLAVERVWGVGIKTAEQLHELRVRTVKDLRALDESALSKRFGVMGKQLYELARGIDNRSVETDRMAKSVGRETTFPSDIADVDVLEKELLKLAVDVGRRLRKHALRAKTITLKARYPDFRTLSRSSTLPQATDLDDLIYHEACSLLRELSMNQPLRLIGITLNNLTDQTEQLTLFDEPQKDMGNLTKVIDQVNAKYGKNSITRARLL